MTNKNNNQNWKSLLNEGRRKKKIQTTSSQKSTKNIAETRTEIERDFDRILFSTPVRRLADKTQVFPLDKNDSVRTRLTHSHEVSNLARSIGTTLAFNFKLADKVKDSKRNIPALLASAGLAHDLGNPPFGHQGEGAIQSWFSDHTADVLAELTEKQHRQDFLLFEGNAQGFRLLTRLQLINDDYGLDLTHASLAALMKYPTSSDKIDNNHVASKKHGFFASEQHVVKDVHNKTKLKLGQRHPLAYLMEACDDIAYTVLDAEDAVKKGLASFSDLMAFLINSGKKDSLVKQVVMQSKQKHTEYQAATLKLSPAELNDVSMQRFRVFAIGAMVRAVIETFRKYEDEFVAGTVKVSLLEKSSAERLRKTLKEFSFKHAYTHRSVLEVELQGYNVIRGLMDLFWAAIIDRTDAAKPESRRRQPFTRYVYGRISENYRRIFENPSETDKNFSMRYRECLLLTDMISGMTDSFAVNLYEELMGLQGEFDPKKVLSIDTK
jgi:dGTPase